MQIEYLNPANLSAANNNSRTHSTEQVEQIAASIQEFGFTNPVLIDESHSIIAGHGRCLAAVQLGKTEVPCIVLADLTAVQKRAYLIADNSLALNAGWDEDTLKFELEALQKLEFDIDVLGFDPAFLDTLFVPEPADLDTIPEMPAEPVTEPGDMWLMGGHRVLCGDSTEPDDIAKLMGTEKAQLLHADPPYGLGKEREGVENDNHYREKLDAFQMKWWRTVRPSVADNAGVYIWGTAEGLWRLWYRGGLADSEKLRLCNEIVWSKGQAHGQGTSAFTYYPCASERCLYIQIGDQYMGSVNADRYWEGWDEIRGYLLSEAEAAGVTNTTLREITGCVSMYSHWFTKSQWALIPAQHYDALAAALPGHFQKPHAELKAAHDKIKDEGLHQGGLIGGRAYFDNTHESMLDVWNFPPVDGEERHGHPTPKPVAIMERIHKSSLAPGGLCLEPFGGSGSTLIGAEWTGRRCYTMELVPAYVDITVRRWQTLTGKHAVNERTGMIFPGAT